MGSRLASLIHLIADLALVTQVIGSRFTEKYLQTRYSNSYSRSSGTITSLYPSIPSRPGSASSPSGSPSSPPRKVVSEFKPFAASSGLSMANTALGADVEEDLMDESKGIELKFSSISLEQVGFFRMLSLRELSANSDLSPCRPSG